jgi:hypothetical protein
VLEGLLFGARSSKRYGFKGLLQGKLSISKFDESFDEDSDEGKKM